jgi:Uma2 family endonuclease
MKREAYQRIGIHTYWAIDRFQRRVMSWAPHSDEATIHLDELRWQPRSDIDPLVIPLPDILPPRP